MEIIIIPISNHVTGLKRQVRIPKFNWDIANWNITVQTKVYYVDEDDNIITTLVPYEKTLTVDNTDFVDATGTIIEDYNSENDYPFAIGQYDFMTNLTLSQSSISDFNTKISDVLKALIIQNVLASDVRGKFN